ncbi:MAG: putative quinol monooxygenase [Candidatus Eiseniibacteriota bacterium]
MLVVEWEYRADPGRVEEFESFYRPDGPWAERFRESPAFISTTLMKDLADPLRFLVPDRWTSEAVYEEFKRGFAAPLSGAERSGPAALPARDRDRPVRLPGLRTTPCLST